MKIKGFTLIELWIVIGIISILASFAILRYLTYQEKAKVNTYALPIARACVMDILNFCTEHNGTTSIVNALPSLSNCPGNGTNGTKVTPGGNVTLSYPNQIICNNSAPQNGLYINATLEGASYYKAKCGYELNSLTCSIVSQ